MRKQISRPKTSLSPKKKAVFAFVTTVLFVGFLELTLRVFGIGSRQPNEERFPGFAGSSPLFVQNQTGDDGTCWWQTSPGKLAWFNEQQFPCQKEPETVRVFCLGGSTTYGRPYDDTTSFCGWLREFLNAADESQQWELINAGGVSYASYRVLRVAEEVLKHDADMLIVYTGHNEFLEKRTYPEITSRSELLQWAISTLHKSRVISVAGQLLSASPQKEQARVKESQLQQFSEEVDTILDSAIGLEAYHRDEDLTTDILEHFEYNLRRIISLAEQSQTEVVLVTPSSQLRDCYPFKSQFSNQTTSETQNRILKLLQGADGAWTQGNLSKALELAGNAVTLDPDFADSQFLLGKVLWESGRFSEAREAFILARENDVCPLRAKNMIVDIVRKVGQETKTPVVDFEKLILAKSEEQTPGADWFLDHVHPTIEGNRQLALAIIEEMQSANSIKSTVEINEMTIAEVTQNVLESIDSAAQAEALLNLSKVLSWANKFDEADRLALQALKLDPQSAEALYQAGAAHTRSGSLVEAEEMFRQGIEADPEHVGNNFGLGLALAEQGKYQEAIAPYERAAQLDSDRFEVHFNLANAYLETKRFALAEKEYRTAIRLNSEYAPAYSRLGLALAEQGLIAAAAKEFEAALSIDPAQEDARSNLERARQLLKK